MAVAQRLVDVPVRVGFTERHPGRMLVPVVLVVMVPVLVLNALVEMFVRVTFAQMEPDPDRHEYRGDD